MIGRVGDVADANVDVDEIRDALAEEFSASASEAQGRVTAILDKMAKQRRESIAQYSQAGRDDLVAVEEAEIVIIQEYLPAALSEAEINELVEASIASTGATSIKDMGKLMGVLKPRLQGRADMGQVSQLIKSRLTA